MSVASSKGWSPERKMRWMTEQLERHKGRCPGCTREFVWHPNKTGLMAYRVSAEHFATIDHKIPKSRGGVYALKNLQLLCSKCNRAKGSGTSVPKRLKFNLTPEIIYRNTKLCNAHRATTNHSDEPGE